MADDYTDLSRRQRDLFSGRGSGGSSGDTTADDLAPSDPFVDDSGRGDSSGPDFDPRPPSRIDRSPDDDRDQTDPGSRSGGGGGGGGSSGGSSDPEPRFETVSGSTTLDPADGRLERIAIDRGLVESERQTVESPSSASRTARTIDAITDGIQRSSPAATAGVSALATSFRSESGIPIPGTNRSLPGREDFRDLRQRLEGPAQRVDSAIGSAVDRTTIDPERAPLDLGDIPLNNPTTAAVGATLATEAGQRGAQAGVERGLESFNPFRAAQDASLFAEFGVRGTDRVLDAEEEEIDEGVEAGTEVAETVREEAPGAATAAVAQDPSRAFEAATAGATIGILGAAGPSAAGAAGRAGRRAAGDVFDSGAIRRAFDTDGRSFIDDTRGQGQLIQRGRSRQRSGGDDELGPPRPRTNEVRDQAGIQRDRARRGFGQGRDGRLGSGRGDPADWRDAQFARDPSQPPDTDFSGLTGSTRRIDGDFETPRDPLDTRPAGFGAVETGATLGGLLGTSQQAQGVGGLFDQATAPTLDEDVTGGLGTGLDSETGTTTGTGTDGDTISGTDTTGATTQGVFEDITGRTRVGTLGATGQLLGSEEATPTVLDDPTTADPVPRGVGTPTNAPRPPRTPPLPPLEPDGDEEFFVFETEGEDDIFGSGIADAEDFGFGFGGDADR